jgi:DNA-binding NarL/FixJ family response regulator
MLMTGSTDTAIAKSLNVNVRSVRRWIAELMHEHGVRTRLQLGAALVRSDIARSG